MGLQTTLDKGLWKGGWEKSLKRMKVDGELYAYLVCVDSDEQKMAE